MVKQYVRAFALAAVAVLALMGSAHAETEPKKPATDKCDEITFDKKKFLACEDGWRYLYKLPDGSYILRKAEAPGDEKELDELLRAAEERGERSTRSGNYSGNYAGRTGNYSRYSYYSPPRRVLCNSSYGYNCEPFPGAWGQPCYSNSGRLTDPITCDRWRNQQFSGRRY